MNVAAGIVLFNPDIERLRINIENIIDQVDELILIDNNSENIQDINELLSRFPSIILHINSKNEGIAKALNQIFDYSDRSDCTWTLLLDQDSVTPNKLIEQYRRYVTLDGIGIICPLIIDRNDNNYKLDNNKTMSNGGFEYVDKCITSGSFINNAIYNEVGKFDEKMFIDYVDFDFCKKIEIGNYKIIQLQNVSLLHEVGKKRSYNIGFISFSTFNHNAFRKYYIVRNKLYYTKKYDGKLKIFFNHFTILKTLSEVIFLENNKLNKIQAIFKGYIDSFKM